jgi:alkylhydroperoxidase family enzyme
MKASTARRHPPGDPPRIAPLPEDAWGPELAAAVEVAGPLALLTTLARHRDLFHAWLGLGAFLLLSGRLPHRVRELAILRIAHNTACVYIRAQHERLAHAAGLGRA